MIRAAVLAVLLVPAAVIGLDTPLVMADSHLPEGAFVTTWKVTDTDKTIKIPMGGQTGNYTVDWGDGTDSTTHVSDATHEYITAGDYTVSISGDFKRIFLNGVQSSSVSEVKNAKQLRSIEQWGDMEWSSMTSAFRGASKMTYNAVDTPDLSNVKSMEYMFNAARAFNGNLSSWNVSQVTNMGFMYQNARAFNGDISSWNVSAVTYTDSMFEGASSFNGDISSWNVSAVTDMNNMFNGASSFNQTLNDWDVSKVTDMFYIFNDASSFNGDISSWNVSAVTDMTNMFYASSSFNGDISSWNVSAVTDMTNMFYDASSFNQTLNDWDVSKVTDMSYMFSGAVAFNQPLNNWNVSKVTITDSMFEFASDFNGDISSWNVSAVTDMTNMFSDASSFNQTLNDWDVSKVTDMPYMFSGAEVFNQPLNDWDVSKVNNTYSMFEFASDFNGDISSWNVSAVTGMTNMFSDASSFNQTLNDWDVSKVTDMSYMFYGASSFNQPLNDWDVSKVNNTDSMFEYAFSFNQPLNDWDVSKVTTMYYMFSSAAVFNQPLNNWNVSAVTDMTNMFSGAAVFNQPINNWNVSKVTHMTNMFSGAAVFNQPLNNWNVSKVTYMTNMFSGAAAFKQNLGSWYVVPADTVYNTSDEMSLVITTIAAQNSVLDRHSHNYGIGTGGNSALFSMTGSNLVFKDTTPSAQVYKVNVTAPGGDFGTNNHRVLDITVEGQDDSTVSADAFVTTWNVTASPYIISIPVEVHTGGTLTIDWGDGTAATTVNINGMQSHTYLASGEYRVSMTGDLSRIILGDVGSTSNNLASIDQWGDIEWSSMKSAFPYTPNMKYNASDVPNLSGVSNMGNMFTRALKFDGDLSEWNVSAVTDMHSVFTHASSFNGNVSTWNVSAVTDMGYMFNGASVFNGDISNWNVSAVTNMRDMFDSASVFNGDISRWNVSAVTGMAEMFHIASVFNGDISGWNVSAVTDMNRMFSGASVFNGDISGWNVSAVTDMHRMFSQAFAFDGDISSWNVSSVTDMSHMFSRATSFDSDISGWNVSSVKDTSYMFSSARSFNQPLNSWNVSAVTAMTDMFSDSRSFNQNLGEWYILPAEAAYDITDASLNVTVISAQNFILDGHDLTYGIDPDDSLDSGLFNMTGSTLMFNVAPSARVYTVNVTAYGSDVFESDNNWRTLTVTVTGQEDSPLSVDAGPDQRVLDESAVTLSGTVSDSDSTDLTYLWTQNSGSPAVTLENSGTLTPAFTAPDVFSDVDLVFTLRVDDGTDTVTDTVTVTVHNAEADFVTTWSDISAGTNFPIRNSTGSFTVDWGDGKISEYAAIATDSNLRHNYDTSGTYTIRISGNFSGIYLQDNTTTAGKLQSIDQWGDIEWTTMAGAFNSAHNMIYNATDVPDLSSVTDMSYMFLFTTSFSSGDLSDWDVSGVTDMRNVFFSSRYTGDLSGWDVSSVTDMQNMFSRASSFDSDLSSWNVSAVNNMASMFFDASSFDSDLSSWNVSAVNNTGSMFLDATSFDSDLSGWDVSSVTDMRTMFTGATSFEQNLGPWYIVLDSDTISYPTQTLKITAQNSFLDGQNPMYGLGVGGYPDLFVVDAAAGTLGLNPNSDISPPPNGTYQANVTSTGNFGTANHRMVEVTVDNADPAVTPPTFDSSVLNNMTGVLTIVFSEPIDVALTNSTKIHIRESGNYTGGITLSADELDIAAADGTEISFTLTESHLTTVKGLTIPELTIEPGAVQATSGNLIDGTFDASTAVFVDATSVASRDDKPQGMAFSSDGTKMFVVGDQNNVIIEYTLSPAFNVSSAVFVPPAFSVASEDGIPTGMAFSNNGTKMFVIGDSGNNINEYTLMTAFDISTAFYNGDAERFSFSSERSYPTDMAFSNDGTQMFVLDNTNDEINEYTLSTPFDISNAKSTGVIFSVTAEEDFPLGIAFSNDGAKMFVVGGNDVNEYTLKAAFDISNAKFVDATALISSGDIATSGIAFSNDGAKMFAITYFGDEIYEYTLSSVYPITVNDTPALSDNADLAGLTISPGTLSPVFSSPVITYAASVDNFVTEVTVTPTASDGLAMIAVNGTTVTSSIGHAVSLNVGANPIAIVVTAQDSTTIKTYTVTVTRAAPLSSDANLGGLMISPGTLSPVFSSPVITYAASVDNSVTEVTVTPTASDGLAMIAVNGTTVTSSIGHAVSLNVGANPIAIVVTAQDSTTIKTYTVTVTRAAPLSSDANLGGLMISPGTLSPVFSSPVITYAASVDNSVTEVTVTPTASDGLAMIAVNGTTVTSSIGHAVSLNVGANPIAIVVTAQDSTTIKTYTVTVTRAAPLSSDANLGGLMISPGTLSPVFSSPVITYAASVDNSVTEVTVTPTASDGLAMIAVNGTTVTSSIGHAVSLNVGANPIAIVVTAQDSTTIKTYTVTVTRAAPLSSDANLGGLMISPGTLSPVFSSPVITYAASVDNSVTEVTVTPTASDGLAMIAVNGTTVTSSIGHAVSLNVGANPIAIVVTAQDSTTIKTYTVTVTRAAPLSSDANLGGLMISPGTLSPVFSSPVITYAASVDNSVTEVTVTPTASDGLAMIAVNGTTVTSSIGHAVSLNVGANPIAIVVTAQDSTTIKTYTVTVTRAAPLSSDANLGGLMISPGTLSPVFSSPVITYAASVDNSVTEVTVTPTASDGLAMIAVNGTTVTSSIGHAVSLNVGANPIAIVVTAQDSTTIKTYTVTVTRAAPLSSDANLGGLMISPGTLSPVFSSPVITYAASVDNSVTEVTVTPTASDGLAMIAVNGTTVTSSIGHAVSLNVGANPIAIVVTAQDSTTIKTYTVTVTRAAPLSSDANLGGLMISPGTLSPVFSSPVITYAASVDNSVTEVTVTPTASDGLAMIAVNGTTVTSSIGHAVSLNVGANPIAIVVTAQDSTTIKTYTVTVTVTGTPNTQIGDTSKKKSSSSKAPIGHINALAQARIVDIPPHIAEQVASRDASEPLEPITPDDTFDLPLVINGYGYLLDDTTNTLVPQTVMTGDDSATHITFTVYTQKDLAHFTLYLNLSDENIDYADSDTYITYKDDGTTSVTDPHGYIGSATVTVTQEDDQIPEKKTVRITVEFAEPMGSTNMVAYMWNTDRKAAFIKIIDALEVVAAPLEPVMQAADPEPLEPNSVLRADPEPVAPDFADDAADPEPQIYNGTAATTPPDTELSDAETLSIIRIWAGFEHGSVTDDELLQALNLDYHDNHIPNWVMTELAVLVSKGSVTADEFVLALQYVLENL